MVWLKMVVIYRFGFDVITLNTFYTFKLTFFIFVFFVIVCSVNVSQASLMVHYFIRWHGLYVLSSIVQTNGGWISFSFNFWLVIEVVSSFCLGCCALFNFQVVVRLFLFSHVFNFVFYSYSLCVDHYLPIFSFVYCCLAGVNIDLCERCMRFVAALCIGVFAWSDILCVCVIKSESICCHPLHAIIVVDIQSTHITACRSNKIKNRPPTKSYWIQYGTSVWSFNKQLRIFLSYLLCFSSFFFFSLAFLSSFYFLNILLSPFSGLILLLLHIFLFFVYFEFRSFCLLWFFFCEDSRNAHVRLTNQSTHQVWVLFHAFEESRW